MTAAALGWAEIGNLKNQTNLYNLLLGNKRTLITIMMSARRLLWDGNSFLHILANRQTPTIDGRRNKHWRWITGTELISFWCFIIRIIIINMKWLFYSQKPGVVAELKEEGSFLKPSTAAYWDLVHDKQFRFPLFHSFQTTAAVELQPFGCWSREREREEY